MSIALSPRGGASAPVRWEGSASESLLRRLVSRVLRVFGGQPPDRLPRLPAVLRQNPLAPPYLEAEADDNHRRAGAVASTASRLELEILRWSPAEAWAQRALWHFEHAGMWLQATRSARRIGEVHLAAGDAAGARRYFAEAISEARDLGATREEGLAALGLGRAELELGNVTVARRLGQIAIDLLERHGALASELSAARELRGVEIRVGESDGA